MSELPQPAPVPVPASEGAPPPGLAERLGREVRAALSGFDLPAVVATLVGMSALIVSHYQGDTSYFRSHFGDGLSGAKADYYPYAYWHLASFTLYLALPLLACALTPGIRARDTGVGLGDWRLGAKATLLLVAAFVPIVWAASRTETFSAHYPLCGAAKRSLPVFVAYEFTFMLYFVGWEYLFRGYLLFSFEKSMGKAAILAQTLPFVVIHYGKPEAEVFGSIVAGIALGVLALRTRSFWYGAALHVAAAFSMDLFASYPFLFR